MGTENDKFAVGHKDLRWLIGADSSEESVNSIGQSGNVDLTLLQVEEKQLPVRGAEGTATSHLGIMLWWGPVGEVIVNGSRDFLLQSLKLLQLQGGKRKQ